MTEGNEQVWINLNKAFVREGVERSDGSGTFNMVTMPQGVMVDGKDVGGYQFSPLYVHDSTMNDNMKGINVLADKEIWLTKGTGEEKDVVKVMPSKLVEALAEHARAYRMEHTTWINVHKAFAHERTGVNGDFYSVSMPPGVMVDGKDLGGYNFSVNPSQVIPSKVNENMVGIPVNSDRDLTLHGGEGFKDAVTVKPFVLVEALAAERQAYREAHPRGISEMAENGKEAALDSQTHPMGAPEREPEYAHSAI